jgi:esterase/lipase superfamily enzyme
VRRYFSDIRTARASIPAFTQLIELLAANTNARHIDILAYSAGAEIASAGLAQLGKRDTGESREALKRRLRLGQIYYAAPDADTRTFADDIQHYVDLPERVSLSANLNDSALAFAQFRHRASRAGRPDLGELSTEQTQFLVDASNKYNFDLIKIDPSVIPDLSRRSHGFWYTNAWVSNDVVATFLRRDPPQARGLDPGTTGGGARYWIFPQDYDKRVAKALSVTGSPPQ